jgi:hypothetical protein
MVERCVLLFTHIHLQFIGDFIVINSSYKTQNCLFLELISILLLLTMNDFITLLINQVLIYVINKKETEALGPDLQGR